MTIVDRFSIRVIATGVGLCGVALALCPDVGAAPFMTGGGYACVESSAGGAAPVANACAPGGAPVDDMAGIPMALPGPVPVAPPPPIVPPLAPPVPVVPAIPAAAPVAAGLPLDVANGYAGKGDIVSPPPAGAPQPGEPILPGPAARPAS